jgi:NAD(P)-dependent dehydrogenase (short-subunit alcohol dehydrogenase family)
MTGLSELLDGKRAIVTGADRRIGAGIARTLAKRRAASAGTCLAPLEPLVTAISARRARSPSPPVGFLGGLGIGASSIIAPNVFRGDRTEETQGKPLSLSTNRRSMLPDQTNHAS